MIELLAIADEDARPEPPARAVRSDGVSVICAQARGDELTAEDLWRREALVERVMERTAALPVRLGARVADEAAAAAAVAGRGSELRSRLDHVRGAVELSVRVQPAGPDPAPSPATGGAYLRARAGQLSAAGILHDVLCGLARDAVVRRGPELLRAAYLVDRARVDDVVARVRELQREQPELAILCTGPWPPYSFAEPA